MFDHKLISGDNHIDLTYCPADLWSSQAPQKWKKLAPRVERSGDRRGTTRHADLVMHY